MKKIDKAIYGCSKNIKRKYTNSLKWIIAGAVCSAALLINISSVWLNALVLTIGWTGVAILASVALYYLVGDCCRPVYRPTGEVMKRNETYYELSQVPLLLTHLENKNLAAIESQPRSFSPHVLFVTYTESSGAMTCAQLLDNTGAGPRPLSEITVIEK